MKTHTRVAVIGGGVVGASVLYHLAKAGWIDIVLIERDELTSGSTWHAAGGMHTLNGDPNVAKLQEYTIKLYREIEEASGQSCSIHITAGVDLAGTPERMDFLKLACARARYLGLDMEIISVDEAARIFPLMDKRHFVGALYNPLEGHVDPAGVTQAYTKAARTQGAEVYRFTRVTGLVPLPDGTWDVITDKGNLRAEHVVNAAGLWAREVGQMVGLDLPVLAMEHQYLVTGDMPEVTSSAKEVLHCIDFEGEIYMRQEGRGMLIGTYEKKGVPWAERSTPWDFTHELLPPDLERIAPSLEVGFRHFPALERAGIKRIVNGPFTFAPDGNPVVGPIRGLRNYWVAVGVMAGFSQGGGVGLALSNWMVHGDPGFDVWAMDVARFGDWATMAYTNAKVRENYSRRFRIRFPNEELPAGRPLRTSPIYDRLRSLGARFGAVAGLEVPMWFAPAGVQDEFSWHRSTDFDSVADEARAVRDGVGMLETTGFAKYSVNGPGAGSWLDHLLACRLPRPGRMVLAPMLKEDGRLIGDFTLANLGTEGYFIIGSGAAEEYHQRWFAQHLPADGSVAIQSRTNTLAGLAIAGPGARELLARVTAADVSNEAFRFMDIRRLPIGMASALVGRVSYTGDLGYELWCEPEYQLHLFEALRAAGSDLGLRLIGSRALNSLRLEKSYGSWAREYRPIYGPLEAGLDRFVAYDKTAPFIGQQAARQEQVNGGTRRLRTFVVDTARTDVIGDEPIWFGEQVRGWVTSGGFAHGSGLSVALGYVDKDIAECDGPWSIEILGERFRARMQRVPLFDSAGHRQRG